MNTAQMIAGIRRGKMDEASRVLFDKHFSNVTIEHKAEDLHNTGVLSEYLSITPIWSGVDRPNVGGWSVGKDDIMLAERLRRAIIAGAAFCDIQILTDKNGQTYVGASNVILGRKMNADLRKLGF